jgi:tryptophan synthase alpha chain
MSRTEQTLQANKQTGGSLIGYFPLGYPNLADSVEAAVAMCEAGVDVLELGIPYSDPVMDGIVIQEATEAALAGGFKLKDAFAAISEITSRVQAPVLVMTYWNPVMQFGEEKFANSLSEAGAAGAITPDLIPDEADSWIRATNANGLDRVFLATPTSTGSRTQKACASSKGFVYAVSTMGITGARDDLDEVARNVVGEIRTQSPTSMTAVGIGVSTAAQVKEINGYADGAIVGSAFVKAYQQGGIQALRAKVSELAEGKKK